MNEPLFEEYYQKYYRSFFFFAFSLTQSEADAHDLVQESFCKAYLSYQESKDSFKTYMFTIVRNTYYTEYKRKQRLVDETYFDLTKIVSDIDVFQEVVLNERKKQLLNAILRLKSPQKEVLMAHLYLQLTNREIATSYGLKEDHVRQLLHRSKQALISELGGT